MTRSIPVRVNQPPWLHQLAILSTGWATFFHPVPDTTVNQHWTTVKPFQLPTFDFSFQSLFSQPDLPTLPTYLPTYLPSLLPTYLPIYIPAYISAHPPSYLPLTECQHSMMDITIWRYCTKIIHNHFSNIWSLMTIKCYRTLTKLLHGALWPRFNYKCACIHFGLFDAWST
jgi:hypothetical protein